MVLTKGKTMTVFDELGLKVEKSNPEENVVLNIVRTSLILTKIMAQTLSVYKLTPPKFNILMLVRYYEKDGGISQSSISKKLIVSGSNITGIIDRLEKAELVVREPIVGDRRVNLVKITDKGKDLVEKAWKVYIEKTEEITESLTKKEKEAIVSILSKWRKILCKKW